MIVTCPECNTRYMVPDAAFGRNGRTFRCASCKHSWFASNPHTQNKAPEKPKEPEPVISEPVRDHISPASYKPQAGNEPTDAKWRYKTSALKAVCAFLLIMIIVLYPVV